MARPPSHSAMQLLLAGGPADGFVNVPIHGQPGEHLVGRPSAWKGIRVEPVHGATAAEAF